MRFVSMCALVVFSMLLSYDMANARTIRHRHHHKSRISVNAAGTTVQTHTRIQHRSN